MMDFFFFFREWPIHGCLCVIQQRESLQHNLNIWQILIRGLHTDRSNTLITLIEGTEGDLSYRVMCKALDLQSGEPTDVFILSC